MKIDLEELLKEGIIHSETYHSIKSYYDSKPKVDQGSRLLQIISLLGIVLVGLGLLLIIGYNWDTMPKALKLVFSCLPLLFSQILGAFTLIKKKDQKLWHEISATAILFGIGIAMALISQIYNLESDLSAFVKWWLVLSVPLLLVFESGFCSLLIWVGIAWFMMSKSVNKDEIHIFWCLGFIVPAIGIYIYRIFAGSDKGAWAWHQIVIPIVLTIFTFVISPFSCQKLVIAQLIILFFIFHLIPNINKVKDLRWINVYEASAFVGTFILAFIYSYQDYWQKVSFHLATDCFKNSSYVILFVYLSVFLIIYYISKGIPGKRGFQFDLKYLLTLLFVATLFGNTYPPITTVLINILILLSTALLVWESIKSENLLRLNLGILLLTIWILCRFFGTELSILTKGIVFIALGLVCFYLNYLLIKKKRA